jgi:hypothetical protein
MRTPTVTPASAGLRQQASKRGRRVPLEQSQGPVHPRLEREKQMTELYFVALALGVPAILVLLAILAGLAHPDVTDVLDWEPTRPPKRNAELKSSEIAQMLEATNHYRRLRGAREQTLDDVLDAHMAQPLS